MKRFLKTSGFTLVEVMIVAAVLGGLALVVSQMTKTLTQSTTKAGFDTDKLMITNEISGMLSNPTKCKNTFGTTATPVAIDNNPGKKYYIKGQAQAPVNGYGNSGIEIVSYTLEVSGNNGLLHIVFQNKNILKGSGTTTTKEMKIELYVEGVLNAITTCRTLASSSSDIWKRGSGANANDIYYNQGNVGIGVLAPTKSLDIDGGIKLAYGEPTGPNVSVGGLSFDGDTGIFATSDGVLNLWSNNVKTMTVYQGTVAIGTTTPAYHLHVESNTTGYTGITNANVSAGGSRWSWLSAGSAASLGAGKMCFETGGFCRLNLTPAGDLTSNSLTTGTITASGNISTSANVSSANITASGTITASGNISTPQTMTAQSFTYTSDRRLKENIEAIEDAVEKIMGLRPVKFRWIKEKKDDYGFIAQEVNKVIPEITSTDDKKIMRVDYAKIVPFLVDTIQKQQKQIEEQQKRIEALEQKIK